MTEAKTEPSYGPELARRDGVAGALAHMLGDKTDCSGPALLSRVASRGARAPRFLGVRGLSHPVRTVSLLQALPLLNHAEVASGVPHLYDCCLPEAA